MNILDKICSSAFLHVKESQSGEDKNLFWSLHVVKADVILYQHANRLHTYICTLIKRNTIIRIMYQMYYMYMHVL